MASKGCMTRTEECEAHNPRGDQIMKTTKSCKDMTRQERREAAQAKAQAALDRIGDGIRSVWESEAWERWLDTLAKFHDYSLNNTMLIAMQMPEATRVASYRSWQRDFGRHVRRGERGIEVLVPMVVKGKAGDAEDIPRDDGDAREDRGESGGIGRVEDERRAGMRRAEPPEPADRRGHDGKNLHAVRRNQQFFASRRHRARCL